MSDNEHVSGGARETDARHAKRDALRPSEYNKKAIAKLTVIGRRARRGGAGAQSLELAVEALRETLIEAMTDPGMPPEVRRNQVCQIAVCLAKAAQPEKQIEELGAELRQAHADMLEMEARLTNEPSINRRDPAHPRTAQVQ